MSGPPEEAGHEPRDDGEEEYDKGALTVAYGLAFGPLVGVLISVVFDVDIGLAIAFGTAAGLIAGAVAYAVQRQDDETAEGDEGGGSERG